MNYTISKITHCDDVAVLERLADKIWREHFTPIIGKDQVSYMLDKFQSAEAIADQLKSGTEYYFIEIDGKKAGYTGLVADELKGKMMLSKIYVTRSKRGTGVGNRLLKFVENECKKRKLNIIRLAVNRFNLGPINWYRRQGFSIVDEVKKDIGGGFYMDDYIMEKNLQDKRPNLKISF